MSSLYKITEDLKPLFSEIESNGGELSEEQEQQLTILETQLGAKVESYNWVIKTAEADVLMAKAEIERLESFIKSKQLLQNKLTNALLEATKLFGIENPKNKVKTLKIGTLTLSTRKTPDAVEITQDVVLMDDMYKKHTITISDLNVKQAESIVKTLTAVNIKHSVKLNIDKSIIKQHFAENVPIIGAKLTSETHLTIK